MRGMKAFEAPRARQGYANGGPVRGPGTGTSDDVPDEVREGTYIMPADSTRKIGAGRLSNMGARGMGPVIGSGAPPVPVNLSNGEFKLEPEQVHAVGVQALDQIKDATHAPVAEKGRGMKPELFFANGGAVGDEQEHLRRQTETYVTRAQAAAASRPVSTAAPAPAAPVVDPARGMAAFGHYPQLAGRQPQNNGAPTAAPSTAPTPPTQVEGWRTKAVMDGAAEDAKAAWDSGSALGAAGAVARGAITAIPTAVGEFAYNTAAPVVRGMGAFYDGLTGGTAQAAQVPSPAAAPTTPSSGSRGMPAVLAQPGSPAATAGSALPGPSSSGELPAPSATPATVTSGSAARGMNAIADMPSPSGGSAISGVYQHGRGQYSDNASGMGLVSGFSGQPSAQNMAAAEALAGRSQAESLARVSSQGTRGMGWAAGPGDAPVVRHSGNDWSARQELRNAEVSASSIMNNGGRWDQHKRESPEAATYRAAVAADNAARGMAPVVAQAAMREQGETARAGMRDQGETQRALIRDAGDTTRAGARNQIDTQRVNLETRGFRFKEQEAQRIEGLNQRYEAAKTPEERSAIAQQIRDMRGVAPQNPNVWDSVALPGSTDAMGNKTEGVLAAVNKQTGEMRRYDGGAKPAPPANHVDALKKNPTLAAQFDQQYGAGAAARVMGGR